MFSIDSFKNKFNFGIYEKAAISPYGVCFSKGDSWYTFDSNDEIIDVTGLVIKTKCIYMIPVAFNTINIGDYILHNNEPVRVVDLNERGSLVCLNVVKREEVSVIPERSPFGFNFYTKLVNIFGDLVGKPDEKNPFGNILPFLLMSEGKGKNDDLMLMMMMSGNQGANINPFMIMAMMDNNKNNFSEILPLLMLSGNYSFPFMEKGHKEIVKQESKEE